MTTLPQNQPTDLSSVTQRKMLCFALSGVQSIDLCGPLEVFSSANLFMPAGRPLYKLSLVSLDGEAITTQADLRIAADFALHQIEADYDSLLICGGSAEAMQAVIQAGTLRDWLHQHRHQFRRIISICSGALLLAASGLLDHKRATTHWRLAPLLQQLFPKVEVDANAIFIEQDPFYTSAGVTSGIDLALALVERDCGITVAQEVARELVLYLRRSGGQNQYSQGLQQQFEQQPLLQSLISEIWEHPERDHSVAQLAAKVCMSERNFSRWFKQVTQQTPARFVAHARLERAKYLLSGTSMQLARVAELSGFGSSDSLQRVFLKSLGMSPGQFRLHFQ